MTALTRSSQIAVPLQPARPVVPASRSAFAVLAWGAMLAILLPSILWVWVPFARPALLVMWRFGIFWPYGLLALCTLTFLWPAVRPLRGFLLAFLSLQTGAMLVSLIANNAGYADWVRTLPFGLRILLTPTLGLVFD